MMQYIPSHQLIVDVSDRKLYAGGRSFNIVANSKLTPRGSFSIETINYNATMKTPLGKLLGPASFGGIIIQLEEAASQVALHSWGFLRENEESSGCIRMSAADIDFLIKNYYFNKVLVVD